MTRLNLRMPKKLWMTALLIAAAVLVVTGGVVLGVGLALNHTVPVTVTISGNSPPPGPNPGPTSAILYNDATCTNAVGSLPFMYNLLGKATGQMLTAYVKSSEVLQVAGTDVTVNIGSGLSSNGIVIEAVLGVRGPTSTPVYITASGGNAAGTFSDNATFSLPIGP
jgi:hypothetical protein